MVNYPNYLSGSQDDINKRFLEMILKAEAGDASAIKALADKVGDESTANTIIYRIKAAEGAIGADDTTEGSLKKRCKAIETAIGDEDTAASILGRIKALEDAS